MQKAYFVRYRQLKVDGVTSMIRGRDINTVLNHCKNALDMQMLTSSNVNGIEIAKTVQKSCSKIS